MLSVQYLRACTRIAQRKAAAVSPNSTSGSSRLPAHLPYSTCVRVPGLLKGGSHRAFQLYIGLIESLARSNSSLMPEAERTVNGDYEKIGYHTFKAVDYDRHMSWKAGNGQVRVGIKEMTSQKAGEDTTDAVLTRGWNLVVDRMELRLDRKP